MAYADVNYYKGQYCGSVIPDEQLQRALEVASMHIDSLTYNRIVGQGFSNLTPFQQGIIQKTCCMQADFEYENMDLIENVLQSYAINGVTMSFGASWNVNVESGIAMRKDVYAILCQSGLCTRRLN